MKKGLLASCVIALLAGCRATQPYVTASRLERGLVIVLPGCEGRSLLNEAVCKGLNDAGLDWAIELSDWTSAWGPLYNLRAEERNRQQAAEIADRIVRYQLAYPGRPVVLVGHSGGGAVAAWTAEAMPPEHKVTGVIMLAVAISPTYMLDQALRNSARGIISFHSLRDWVLTGTRVAGTMDGEHGPSAGRVGFQIAGEADRPKIYDKLFQIPWQPEMSRTGHSGGHLGYAVATFVASYVAPFVAAEDWNEDVIGGVLQRQAAGAPPPPASTQPATSPSTTVPADASSR